jgi:hypothetical protein
MKAYRSPSLVERMPLTMELRVRCVSTPSTFIRPELDRVGILLGIRLACLSFSFSK